MTTINLQVSGTNRDGRQVGTGPPTVEQISTLRITSVNHWAFHKFTGGSNMPPKNATITSATLQLHIKTYTTAKFYIYAEDNSSPADLNTSDTDNLSSRTTTTAKITVNETVTNNTWESWSITSVIQELVNRSDWSTSSSIAILMNPTESTCDFASTGWVDDISKAAKLNITWASTEANFTGSPLTNLYEGSSQDSVTFDNLSSTDDPGGFTGGSSGWLWEYKKSVSWVTFSTSFEPTLTNLTSGTYDIRLTATSNNGDSDSFTRNNYFTVAAPLTATAAFTANLFEGIPGVSINFTSSSTTTDPGGLVQWNWERRVGLGSWQTFSGAENPSGITFSDVGSYDIRLNVTSDLGATDSTTELSYITISSLQRSVLRPYGAPGAPLSIVAKPPARSLIPIASSTGVAINFFIGDSSGKVLTEIRPEVSSVAWIKNKISQLKFRVSRTDSRFNSHYLKAKNRVLLDFDNGLPTWAGYIAGPISWDSHSVTYTAYSAEGALFSRRPPREISFEASKVGAIFRTLIDYQIGIDPAGWVSPGDIWGGGPEYAITYNYTQSIGQIARDSLVADLAANDMDVTGKLVSGKTGSKIEFFANLYENKGVRHNNYAFQEGGNITSWVGRTETDVINVWYMASDGEGWGDNDRLYSSAIDEDSISEFCRWESFESAGDQTVQDSVTQTANSRLDQTANPKDIVAITVEDVNPAMYKDYDVCDWLRTTIPTFGYNGFDEFCQVIGREFFPTDGVCDLVIEGTHNG